MASASSGGDPHGLWALECSVPRSPEIQTMRVFLFHMLAGASITGGLERARKEMESPVDRRAVRINHLTRVTFLRLYDSELVPTRAHGSLESFVVYFAHMSLTA